MKYIIILLVLFGLFSCGSEGMDEQKCLDTVKATFPHSEIYKKAQLSYTFIVVDSTGIKEVRCQSTSLPKITEINSLIKLN